MRKIIYFLACFLLVFTFMSQANFVRAEEDLMIADFEGWSNCVSGEVGVYGSLEPDWSQRESTPCSWFYGPKTPGYTKENVNNGAQSFRLVNGLGSKPNETWGSFSMDLGPITDLTKEPKEIKSLDVSGYKYLVFWVKGEKGGEHLKVLFRAAHTPNYMPQTKYEVRDATTKWEIRTIPLDDISQKVDLSALDSIGIAFGPDAGNKKGDIIYLDNFMFTNKKLF